MISLDEFEAKMNKVLGVESHECNSLEEFISSSNDLGNSSVNVTITCKVSPINGRIAFFSWGLTSESGTNIIKYHDKESLCWFDDGFLYPGDPTDIPEFSWVNVRKGSQYDHVLAYIVCIKTLAENNISIGSLSGIGVSDLVEWIKLVSECLFDEERKTKYERMFSQIPKTIERGK